MQVTSLTVLTVHNPSWITGTVHSLSFSAMSLIRWAATTAAPLGVRSLAQGLSCTGWFGGVSQTSQDSSIRHKCWIARSKYDFPALSLAPRTTPSRPLMSFTMIPILHFHGCAPHSGSKPHHQLLGSTPWSCVSDCVSPLGSLCIPWSSVTTECPCTDEHISLS